eukprot:COSAG02_NODE_1422_length_12685_cov_69.610361_12_plen_230_part_00
MVLASGTLRYRRHSDGRRRSVHHQCVDNRVVRCAAKATCWCVCMWHQLADGVRCTGCRVLFNAAVVCALMLDLLVVSDGGARGSKQALIWTMVWVAASLVFCAQLYFMYNVEVAVNFLTGYVIEESLSLDNLFVILLTFESFRIQKADQHKVLFWGILSAIILRGACIFAGLALIQRFEWMLQMFGVLLLVAVFRILTEEEEEEEEDDRHGEFHSLQWSFTRHLFPYLR